ncbi:hypothetical protein O6P43_001598 [Quillaja saponaria]|uniref:Uncharacterized protein n=1 Tax=Quillaja saponaria TaxID=32244 RepID=A0AAD7VNM4_QUISA|nr:hypothetical protein O6P43_001598 [Quillaja saponaria]
MYTFCYIPITFTSRPPELLPAPKFLLSSSQRVAATNKTAAVHRESSVGQQLSCFLFLPCSFSCAEVGRHLSAAFDGRFGVEFKLLIVGSSNLPLAAIIQPVTATPLASNQPAAPLLLDALEHIVDSTTLLNSRRNDEQNP